MAIKRSKTRRKRRRSPSLRQQLKSKVLPLLIKTVLFCFLGSLVWVIALRFINPPITYLMLKRGFERQASGKEWKIDKKWVDYADRKSTRLNSSHVKISYAVFCLKKKKL